MPDRSLLDSGQVAQRLAMSRDSFCRKWRGLVAEHGFPGPVPGCGRHWDPVAIDRWLDLQLPGHLPGCDTRPGAVNQADAVTGETVKIGELTYLRTSAGDLIPKEPRDVQEILRRRLPNVVDLVGGS